MATNNIDTQCEECRNVEFSDVAFPAQNLSIEICGWSTGNVWCPIVSSAVAARPVFVMQLCNYATPLFHVDNNFAP